MQSPQSVDTDSRMGEQGPQTHTSARRSHLLAARSIYSFARTGITTPKLVVHQQQQDTLTSATLNGAAEARDDGALHRSGLVAG